jgi:hypothetical protein
VLASWCQVSGYASLVLAANIEQVMHAPPSYELHQGAPGVWSAHSCMQHPFNPICQVSAVRCLWYVSGSKLTGPFSCPCPQQAEMGDGMSPPPSEGYPIRFVSLEVSKDHKCQGVYNTTYDNILLRSTWVTLQGYTREQAAGLIPMPSHRYPLPSHCVLWCCTDDTIPLTRPSVRRSCWR